MHQIKLKIIFIQFFGSIFLIQGIQNIYFSIQNNKFNCLIEYFENPKCECINELNLKNHIGDFMANVYLWFFYGFLISILIFGYINWKKNRHLFNTIITITLLFILFPLKFFRNEYISFSFRQVGCLFTNDFGIQNLIGGITYSIIGSFILWKSYRNY
ncbi:hypothetical protein [Flavobacterium sp.]|jgi:hypothetical protein|uniref:hypothetical protein n=1 Tax=Flavobacterium sp. TaxID=239 RepID=UPI002A812751|nr:hypothetical protein [Flavobacterium sp.]